MRHWSLPLALVLLAATALAAEKPPATPAPAAATQYGKPVETDITPGKVITYPSNGESIRAYLVTPKDAKDAPAVVLVHDIFGLNEWIRARADELGRQGYIVIVPDLYARQAGTFKDDIDKLDAKQAWVAYENLSDNQAVADLKAAVSFLKDKSSNLLGEDTRVGVVGIDMGGIYAVLLASTDLRVQACVNYYGRAVYSEITSRRPVSPVDTVTNLHAPILNFYGEIDPQNPPDQVRLLEQRLSRNPNKADFQVIRYPRVGHSFINENRPGYNKEAAEDARRRTRDFLAKVLRAEPEKDE